MSTFKGRFDRFDVNLESLYLEYSSTLMTGHQE